MTDKVITVGPDGDFPTLSEALPRHESGWAIVLKPGEHLFSDPIVFTASMFLQSAEGEPAVLTGPLITFDMPPNVFVVVTNISFRCRIEIRGGSTVSFEACRLTYPGQAPAIVAVFDSSPTFRLCHFCDFAGVGVDYFGSKGGILTDCIFENVAEDPTRRNNRARPFIDHNTVK
jgi:hypothetical protein